MVRSARNEPEGGGPGEKEYMENDQPLPLYCSNFR